jgi:hypothetical protein
MNHLEPGYLLPDILIGTVAVLAVTLFGWRRAVLRAGLSIRDRRRALGTGSTVLLAWCFAALLLSRAGFYQGASSRFPTVPFGLFLPIVAGVVLFRRSPLLRRVVETVPQAWLVSVQVYRAEGVIFLLLYAAGRLPGEFALPAGIGDAIVGLLAPAVGIACLLAARGASGWLRAWNLLGLADLTVATATGFLTSPSPLQLLALDRPNQLITSFPLVMIPVFLVPLSVLLHLASLEKLRQMERRSLEPGNPALVEA